MWGYELSPFVVVVKETLSELELPYKQVRTTVYYTVPFVILLDHPG